MVDNPTQLPSVPPASASPVQPVKSKKRKYFNRNTIFFIFIISCALAIGMYFIFTKIIFPPPLSATMKINKSTIKPIGIVTADSPDETIVKNSAILTITYTNNTSRPLKNVRILLDEIKSAGEKNLMAWKGINVIDYRADGPRRVIFYVQELPPKTTNYIQLHFLAQHGGSARMVATVVSDKIKAKTNTISLNAR